MNLKTRCVIFDMDGVLLDTEPLWGESMMAVAQSHGIKVGYNELRFTTGLRIHEVTRFWADKFPWEKSVSSDEVAEDILDHIIANAKVNGRVMPGIKEHLEYLKQNKFPIGVATSSPRRMLQALLEHYDLLSFFDVAVCGDEVSLAKPHPEIYLKCAALLGIPGYDCTAVEDSVNGMVAAKAARMRVIAVPEQAKLKLPAFGLADKVVPSMEALPPQFWDEF